MQVVAEFVEQGDQLVMSDRRDPVLIGGREIACEAGDGRAQLSALAPPRLQGVHPGPALFALVEPLRQQRQPLGDLGETPLVPARQFRARQLRAGSMARKSGRPSKVSNGLVTVFGGKKRDLKTIRRAWPVRKQRLPRGCTEPIFRTLFEE